MTEAQVQRAFQAEVKRRGGKAYKLHGSPYSVAGQPDVIGALDGVSFAVEFKTEGKRPTPKQEHELAAWAAQGWAAGVATSVEEALAIVGPMRARAET